MHGLPPSDLVEAHLWIVDHFHAKYRRLAPRADLHRAGALGLCEAAARFEPEKGRQFSTYAWNWVKGYMLRELRCSHVVAVPEHTARRALAAGNPVRGVVVFDTPEAPSAGEQEQKTDESMRRRTLVRLAGALEPDLRAVVEACLGGQPEEQIAEQLGLSHNRLEQLLARAERVLAEAFWMEGRDNLTTEEMRALVRERSEALSSLQAVHRNQVQLIAYLQEQLTAERELAEELTRKNLTMTRALDQAKSGQIESQKVRSVRKLLRQVLKELKTG